MLDHSIFYSSVNSDGNPSKFYIGTIDIILEFKASI